MEKKSINARFSVSYPSRGRDDEEGKVVSIRVECNDSRIEFVDLEISYEEFTAALSGLQYRPTSHCEVRGLENIGKKHEYETFKMYAEIEGGLVLRDKSAAEKFLEQEAKKQGFCKDGWKVDGYGALNSYEGKGKDEGGTWFKMGRYRWV